MPYRLATALQEMWLCIFSATISHFFSSSLPWNCLYLTTSKKVCQYLFVNFLPPTTHRILHSCFCTSLRSTHWLFSLPDAYVLTVFCVPLPSVNISYMCCGILCSAVYIPDKDNSSSVLLPVLPQPSERLRQHVQYHLLLK